MITGNESAFPMKAWGQQEQPGLTIRQHLQTEVLKGLLAGRPLGDAKVNDRYVELSGEYADKLIEDFNRRDAG